MKTPKILHLEDSNSDSEIIGRFLRKTYSNPEVMVTDNRDAFKKALVEFTPDIILSDHSLFQFNSIEALHIIKDLKLDLPFILVTGTVSEEFAVTILKEGADDYVLKNNLSRLPIAINNAIKERQTRKEKDDFQKKLIEKNNELNTLVYKITHDLRGPVCSILGLTELIKKTKEDPGFDYLDKIEETTIKLDMILQTMTEMLYNIDADSKPQVIHFEPLLKEILDKFEFIRDYKLVKVTREIEGSGSFYSDVRILSSVLQNLIENGYKYRNRAILHPKVHVHIKYNDKQAIIIISDNGIGIAPEIQVKIFDMFFRGHSESKGSGLGLYLVKKGLEKISGSYELKSVPNQGTSFILKLDSLKV